MALPPTSGPALDALSQNRSSWPVLNNVIQKLIPSLQAVYGEVLEPVPKDPRTVRSAAFQSETLSPLLLVTRTRSPSNAAACGET
jgi:hypothetical protein